MIQIINDFIVVVFYLGVKISCEIYQMTVNVHRIIIFFKYTVYLTFKHDAGMLIKDSIYNTISLNVTEHISHFTPTAS